jgi:hypothetical protein
MPQYLAMGLLTMAPLSISKFLLLSRRATNYCNPCLVLRHIIELHLPSSRNHPVKRLAHIPLNRMGTSGRIKTSRSLYAMQSCLLLALLLFQCPRSACLGPGQVLAHFQSILTAELPARQFRFLNPEGCFVSPN